MPSSFLARISDRFAKVDREKAVAQAQRQAEAGRRLSIYDRETGFLAPWYLLLRAREEMVRSNRYKRPLSLVILEAPAERWVLLNGWLGAHLRMTDLVCRDTGGVYFILLTETGGEGASTVVKRLAAEIEVTRVSIAEFPREEERVKQLLAPLEARWRLRDARAA
jgi:GGDEF domain-containing protein